MHEIEDNPFEVNYKPNPSTLGEHMDCEAFLLRDDVNHRSIKIAFLAAGQSGGNIAVDMYRMGFYVHLTNTCAQDALHSEKKLRKIKAHSKVPYKITVWPGYDGAAKKRRIGQMALVHNPEMVQKEILEDPYLQEADMVFVVGSGDGGTGSGSIPTLIRLLSTKVRNGKKRHNYAEYKGKVIEAGLPTIAALITTPDDSATFNPWQNVGELINELMALQREGHLGAIIPIDNQKVMDDFLSLPAPTISWMDMGNGEIARFMAESVGITSMAGMYNMDKAEWLQQMCTPGFLSVCRLPFSKSLKSETTNSEMIQKAFVENGLFAMDFDYTKTLVASMAILYKQDVEDETKRIFSERETVSVKQAFNEFLSSAAVKDVHVGFYDNDKFGSYKIHYRFDKKEQGAQEHVKSGTTEALLYGFAVVSELPKRIQEKVDLANKQSAKYQENLSSMAEGSAQAVNRPSDGGTFKSDKDESLDDIFDALVGVTPDPPSQPSQSIEDELDLWDTDDIEIK